jgi:hypothetical protein
LRLDREGAGECDALALPTGKLMRKTIAECFQLHAREQVVDSALDLGALGSLGARTHIEAEGDILRHGHMAKESIVLEDEALPHDLQDERQPRRGR